MGTHSDECDHKEINCSHKKKDSEVPCLSCHLSMKRNIRIRCSYRCPERKGKTRDKSFRDLKKRLDNLSGVTIEKISSRDYDYQIILFKNSKEPKKHILKEIIMSEKYGFFGDRPAMYFFSYDEGKPYVGESRNSFQRLNNHLGKKEISKGGIVINTTENKYWADDPLNSTNTRLVLERFLKHLVYKHTNNTNPRIDKWVTCTKDEEEMACKLAEEIYKCAEESKSKYWRNLVDTKKEPRWSPSDVPAWYETPKKT